MTATITRPKLKKTAAKAQSPYKRLHVIIPIEDMLWASQQKPSVTQLWQECWTADPYVRKTRLRRMTVHHWRLWMLYRVNLLCCWWLKARTVMLRRQSLMKVLVPPRSSLKMNFL